MGKPIRLAEDTIDQQELAGLARWIEGGNRLTKGELTLEFEKQFSAYIGSKYSVFVNSGSSANLLMIFSLLQSGRLKNNIAIAPAVSWITTVSPLLQFGFETHLCDCNLTNLGMDLDHLEQLCEQHQPALLIICDVLGHANDMSRIHEICKKFDILLLEDSCEALGSELDDKKLGTLGLVGSFSFYYGHHISTIEGGMVVTDDQELFNLMRSIRSHGWGRDLESHEMERLKTRFNIDEFRNFYTFYYPGFNLRSTDLNAYLGLSQLKKMPAIVEKRNANFNHYRQVFKELWCQQSDTTKLSSFAYGTFVKDRLSVYQKLKDCDIESRPLICGNLARHPFWTGEVDDLPHANQVHDDGMYFPNHFNLDLDDIERIYSVIYS